MHTCLGSIPETKNMFEPVSYKRSQENSFYRTKVHFSIKRLVTLHNS